jgi:hypothetical protein
METAKPEISHESEEMTFKLRGPLTSADGDSLKEYLCGMVDHIVRMSDRRRRQDAEAGLDRIYLGM